MSTKDYFLANEDQQIAFAETVALNLRSSFVLLLKGDLGVGKTTFARGFVHASGFEGIVKSPTYTLVEPYPISNGRMCYHFDLYRLADPEELEFIGARDYFNESDVCLVEWPENAEGFLPVADWICEFSYQDTGRNLFISALTDKGKKLMLQVFSDF
ncbi:MAG TPA: tRNA (adenosine(37)-N6)-threonylcarbamoyltransferase complex ATPase subunit type 1 TsaE [Gammaproteobacteria bacterium]|nr:tRNA (adenosine(37)-N6)-threonylcarbamoyltransferase complex ATPase subunit type 1 TsaE [Gammaproteobacteria bacterium]